VRSRRVLVLAGALALVVVVALLVAGSRDVTEREFVLGVPNQRSVALIRPGQRVCEGPVTGRGPIQAVGIWGGSAIGLSRLSVEVLDAGTRSTLASGKIAATVTGAYVAQLTRAVSGGRPLRVCVVGDLNTFSLLGSNDGDPAVSTAGTHGGEFSLVLLNQKRSLLSWLPTAFGRASLFRPSWVGSWTFWLLAAGLLAAFGVGAVAVASAAADDGGDRDDRDRDGDGDGEDRDP
jgi:hypothetical protein